MPAATGSASASATTIDVNLTASVPQTIAAGQAGGFAPLAIALATGTTFRFVNADGFAHTASSFGGATFPTASPIGSGALAQSGGTLSGGFSTGTLAAGGASQPILADAPGRYLYGCFFHYGAPMRAEIDVR